MVQNSIRRSPRFSSNQVETEIRCHISSSKKITSRKREPPKKDSFDALALTVYNGEISSRKSETKESSFLKQEEINEATTSPILGTSDLKVEFPHKREAKPSPFSLCKSHEEEPELFCCKCNSHFIGDKLLRSPRLCPDSNYSSNVDSCSGFDMKIDKPLRRSPRSSLSSCGIEQSKSLENQTFKMRHSPQTSIFARGVENSIIRHSSSELLESGIEYPLEKTRNSAGVKKKKNENKMASFFVGDPVPADEAQQKWKWRYEMKVIFCLYTICNSFLAYQCHYYTSFIFVIRNLKHHTWWYFLYLFCKNNVEILSFFQ